MRDNLNPAIHLPMLTLRVVLIIESIDSWPKSVTAAHPPSKLALLTDSNLLIKPIPRTLVRDRDERPIRSPLQRNTHPRPLLRNGLNIVKSDIPLHLQLLALDQHDAVIR